MTTLNRKVYQVAVVLYNGADILDFAGPIEMLTHIYYNDDPLAPDPAFTTHIIAETPTVRAGGSLTVSADMTLEEASKRLDDFDIVVMPGGPPRVVLGLAESDSPEVQFIRKFATHTSSGLGGGERVILSVCTGALLLGATGAMGGLTLTTHHLAYDLLRHVCEKAQHGAEAVHVVSNSAQRRYVDGGVTRAGVKVVTAGGITCGLDASLHLAALKVGEAAAEAAAKLTEHEWKKAVYGGRFNARTPKQSWFSFWLTE